MKSVLLILALFAYSKAFQVVLVNRAEVKVLPQVQIHDSSAEAPDYEGFLRPSYERVYDNGDSWLNSPSMAVKEGDIRTVSFVNGRKISKCGRVTFKRGTVVAYTADGSCSIEPMPTIDSKTPFSSLNEHFSYAQVVSVFYTGASDDDDRYYARGPAWQIWDGTPGSSTVTFQAVEHSSGRLNEIKTLMRRYNGCARYQINDAVGCSSAENPISKLHADKYDHHLNPFLPPGRYSGVAKIKGAKWGSSDDVQVIYLNLEVVKEK